MRNDDKPDEFVELESRSMNAYIADSAATSFVPRDVEDSSFRSLISRRSIVFLGIVLLHAFLIYAFSSGLAHRIVTAVAPPLETTIIEEVQKRDLPAPPPPLKLERPPVEVPPPEIAIDVPTETAITDITDKQVQPVAALAPPRPSLPELVTEPFGRAGYLNNPPPEYPAMAARQKWEGTVVLRVRVLSTGKVDAVQVAKSSGHKVLDDQAQETVRGWVFRPSKRGATPIDGWATVPIEFKIDT
jgi:protein TonB